MKSYAVHLKNKYPGCQVSSGENHLEAYSSDGSVHLVSLERNAHGQWVDRSKENGCAETFSLSPIPKEARRFKLYENGMIGKAEEFEERTAYALENAVDCGGYLKILGAGEKAPVVSKSEELPLIASKDYDEAEKVVKAKKTAAKKVSKKK